MTDINDSSKLSKFAEDAKLCRTLGDDDEAIMLLEIKIYVQMVTDVANALLFRKVLAYTCTYGKEKQRVIIWN